MAEAAAAAAADKLKALRDDASVEKRKLAEKEADKEFKAKIAGERNGSVLGTLSNDSFLLLSEHDAIYSA